MAIKIAIVVVVVVLLALGLTNDDNDTPKSALGYVMAGLVAGAALGYYGVFN